VDRCVELITMTIGLQVDRCKAKLITLDNTCNTHSGKLLLSLLTTFVMTPPYGG